MGGTFDPVHTGHLACAEAAREACGLDAVLFMVAPRPSLKQEQPVTDARMRADMCAAAVEGNPAFGVSTMEMDRPGVTYTADTLRELRERCPKNVELFFIVGSDSLVTLPDWRDAEALAELATFVCVSRPDGLDAARLARRAEERGFRIEWVDAPLLDISSRDIRKRVGSGKTIRYLVPEGVRAYIMERGLYRGERDA